MVGAAPVDELLVGLELVAAGAEPAGVHALVHVAIRRGAADHLGRGDRMVRIGGADESVEADGVALEGALPGRRPRVDQVARVHASVARVALDVGRMLVQAGQEAGLATHEPLVARDHVGADGLEHRMQRGALARIEDRRGQVVGVARAHRCSRPFGQYSSLRICSGAKPRSVAIWSTAVIMSGLPHR